MALKLREEMKYVRGRITLNKKQERIVWAFSGAILVALHIWLFSFLNLLKDCPKMNQFLSKKKYITQL